MSMFGAFAPSKIVGAWIEQQNIVLFPACIALPFCGT
jgi:hypothetical protein